MVAAFFTHFAYVAVDDIMNNYIIAVVSGRVSVTGADEAAHPGGAGKTVRW